MLLLGLDLRHEVEEALRGVLWGCFRIEVNAIIDLEAVRHRPSLSKAVSLGTWRTISLDPGRVNHSGSQLALKAAQWGISDGKRRNSLDLALKRPRFPICLSPRS